IDPILVRHDGVLRPAANSPALNAATGNYAFVIQEDDTRASAKHVGAHEQFAPVEGEGEELPPPPAPGQFKAEVGDSEIRLSWQPAARAASYTILRSNDGFL